MPKTPRSGGASPSSRSHGAARGGAKKARWSGARKAQARKATAASSRAAQRDERGERGEPATRDERAQRPADRAGQGRPDPRGRDDRGPRYGERRDGGYGRRGDGYGRRREDRGSQGDRPSGRGAEADRGYREDRGFRSDRTERGWDARGDRAGGRFDRDDRGNRAGGGFRGDREPGRYDRQDRGYREDRGFRGDRTERGWDARGDRAGGRFDREERGNRADRGFRGDREPGRDDRPQRGYRDDRQERGYRDNRGFRGDREPGRDDRQDRGYREDRGAQGGRGYRDDRQDRGYRDERGDRGYRTGGDDRPRFRRSWDGEPLAYRPERRGDRHTSRSETPHPRSHTPRERDRRAEREARQADQTRAYAQRVRGDIDPESQRLEADHWTSSRRASRSGPVQVADDNAFLALGLPPVLVERLARDEIVEPFPIQSATIPDALAGRDVLGRGRTGSGKTLAFGLPTVARLQDEAARHGRSAPKRPRALVLVPTRELAMQVSDALEPLVHVAGLRHKLVAGGLSYTHQIAALERGIDLLIATPGRLVDLIERGAVDLGDVRIAVVDEADHLADMGFLPEVTAILDTVPAGGQRLLFSATLDNGIDQLVERYLSDPVLHATDEATASVTTMEHHVLLVNPQDKKVITAEIANRQGRTLVFVRTKLGADRVAAQLRELGVLAVALHGGLTQGARNRVLGAFRDGTLPVLVATDVAARGIHVDDVSVVLQVDPPADHKDYLHRAGRTARAGDTGQVFTLALPHQRRLMERQLESAGVPTAPVRTAPGDRVIAETGGRTPTGEPIPDHVYRSIVEPRPKRFRPTARPRPARSGGRGPRN